MATSAEVGASNGAIHQSLVELLAEFSRN